MALLFTPCFTLSFSSSTTASRQEHDISVVVPCVSCPSVDPSEQSFPLIAKSFGDAFFSLNASPPTAFSLVCREGTPTKSSDFAPDLLQLSSTKSPSILQEWLLLSSLLPCEVPA
ncbi:hypothetical protein Droror1_Dr00012349 [Drosera rotundifolia]